METIVYHYTNLKGYNGIRGKVWRFLAHQQRAMGKPVGAYFTVLRPTDPNFIRRLRLPKEKRQFVFAFSGKEDLVNLEGTDGRVFYSKADYHVSLPRQRFSGKVKACRFPGI